MNAVTANKDVSAPESNRWQKEKDIFTGDDLIDAYFKGRADQEDEMKRVYMSTFDNNIKKSQAVSEKVFGAIIDKGFNIHSIHLKADSVTKFDALFLIDSSDFVKDEFRDAFIIARAFKTEVEDTAFSINFTFSHYSSNINEKDLSSEGFIFRFYGKK